MQPRPLYGQNFNETMSDHVLQSAEAVLWHLNTRCVYIASMGDGRKNQSCDAPRSVLYVCLN